MGFSRKKKSNGRPLKRPKHRVAWLRKVCVCLWTATTKLYLISAGRNLVFIGERVKFWLKRDFRNCSQIFHHEESNEATNTRSPLFSAIVCQ